MNTVIGYLRVSTTMQDLEKNKADILHLANDKRLGHVEWVDETVSGKVSWKTHKLGTVIERLEEGDTLIVSELSRLGRSMLECMEILSIAMERRINIYAVKGEWKLDDSIQSKIVAMAFAMAAEIERELLSQRTKEALAAKKRMGMKLGRPVGTGKSKLDKHRPEIEALLANGSTLLCPPMILGQTFFCPSISYLTVNGADKTIQFLIATFGTTELRRELVENGKVNHTEVRIDDSVLMLAYRGESWPAKVCK